MNNIFHIILLIGLTSILSIIVYTQIECDIRSQYWNDKGFFIDSWEYSFMKCDYPSIPIGDNN